MGTSNRMANSDCSLSHSKDIEFELENKCDKDADDVFVADNGDEEKEDVTLDPISKEESERLQREANEETTNSEDLRLFLEEMHQHVHQQQQQQQQLQVGSTSQMFGSTEASHQPPHQPSARSHTIQPQASNNIGAVNTHKRSVTGPEQDYVIDSSPDGGWGWIVVFSSFMCMILVEGICLSYGLLVAPICPGNSLQALEVASTELLNSRLLTATSLGIVWPSKARTVPIRPGTCLGISEMGEALSTQSRMALMSPGGMLVGMYLLFGPLASAISNQFDFRPVAMTGGVIAAIGLLSAAFSTNVVMLNVTLGGIGGIGLGLVYLPAIAAVGHWFKRRRPFAVGLALCGSGVASIVGGQVFPLLIQSFTWSGALIVLAAFCMQCLVLMVLFRPLDLHLRIKHYQNIRRQAYLKKKKQQDARISVEEQRRQRRIVRTEEATARAQAVAIIRARAAKKALNLQQMHQRRTTYRGSIMQRIIEEKRRQRTVSVGSLDGMVITGDNELIAAPLVADRPPLLTAASITRISEAVMRKMETRLAGLQDGCGGVNFDVKGVGGNEAHVQCDSNVSQPSLSRKSSSLANASHANGLSRLNVVRESLPQLIQDYVQSQASIVVQNYITKQQQQQHLFPQSGTTAASGYVSGAATIAAVAGNTSPAVELRTAFASNPRYRSISNATSIYPAVGCSTPQTQKARALSSLQSRDLTVATVEVPSSTPRQAFYIPSSSCASECLGLRRTTSEISFTPSNRGAQVPQDIQQEVAELLDDEVRAEVRHRLRREMMRPRYKKDIFFAGSTQQLDHIPVSAIPLGDAINVWITHEHSNWDIGPTLTSAHNPPTTSNVTISTRPETDGATPIVAPPATAIVDPKPPCLTSSTAAAQNQTQQLLKVSQTASKCTGDATRVVLDYEEDGEDVTSMSLSTRKKCRFSGPIWIFLEELLAPSLLLSPTFMCLLLSNVFTIWGIVLPYFMLPDLVAESNWTLRQAGYIISYIGFANTLGRCLATLYIEKAWSSHYKWADCLHVNVGFLLLSGVACAVMPLVGRSYNLVVFVGCLFGLFSAVVVSLKSIIVVELLGLDKLTNAFGHMLLIQGVASIVGTIIGGYLFDTIAASAPEFVPRAGSNAPLVYAAEACFYFAGCSFLLAALFALPLRRLATREVILATYTTNAPGIVAAAGCAGGTQSDDYANCGEGGAVLEDGHAAAGVSAFTQALPSTEPGTAIGNADSSTNLAHSSVLQLSQQSPPLPPTHFDSVIACFSGDPTSSAIMESASNIETVEHPQQLITDPSPFFSPAPLPSSLFITTAETEAQPQLPTLADIKGLDINSTVGTPSMDGKVGVAESTVEEERGDVITTAGVPMGNPPSRSAMQPLQSSQAKITSEPVSVWNVPGSASVVAVAVGIAVEMKPSLVAEEPALEPVKEEEEEMEEFPLSAFPHLSLPSRKSPDVAEPAASTDSQAQI